jgi:hypothetical protein
VRTIRSASAHLGSADGEHGGAGDPVVGEIRAYLECGRSPPLAGDLAGTIAVFVSGHTHAPSLTGFEAGDGSPRRPRQLRLLAAAAAARAGASGRATRVRRAVRADACPRVLGHRRTPGRAVGASAPRGRAASAGGTGRDRGSGVARARRGQASADLRPRAGLELRASRSMSGRTRPPSRPRQRLTPLA